MGQRALRGGGGSHSRSSQAPVPGDVPMLPPLSWERPAPEAGHPLGSAGPSGILQAGQAGGGSPILAPSLQLKERPKRTSWSATQGCLNRSWASVRNSGTIASLPGRKSTWQLETQNALHVSTSQ